MVVSVPAQDTVVTPAAAANSVVIEHFEFRYGLQHPALPSLEELNRLGVRLTKEGTVWHPAPANAGEVVKLGSIPEGSRFDGDALREIAQEVVRWYNVRGLFGVWVSFLDVEASSSGLTDHRPADDRTARLVVWASQVAELRTLARGNRFKTQFSVNNRKHRSIIANSPLPPGKTPDAPGSLFRKDLLDDYLHGLSQHPGRLVEASIASAGEPGKVVLDFLVNESKPWQIFSQVTNFGTESTGIWRGRLGFQHNQLTNHDDILNIDAISTPDRKTYGSFLSYRIPMLRPAKLLVRVYGSYGDFLAGDASLQSLRFAGRNWLGGLELTNPLSLPRNWQLVTALGANFNHYQIQSRINTTPLVSGFSNFLVPFLGTTLSRESPGWALSSSLRFDHTVGRFANTNATNGISALGRIAAEPEWTSLRWTLNGSLYLESLFQRSEQARFPANEVSLRLKGRQLLRGKRLIPHEQEPIGGALSVRGYAESVLAADQFISGSFEYAFHIPRLLKPGEPGKLFRRDFKWRPAKPGQTPDWDLVVRAFYDYAYRQVTPPKKGNVLSSTGELSLIDRTVSIAGAGGGLELLVRQNFSIRGDVGMALTELRDNTRPAGQEIVVPAGQIRYYISSSFTW